MSSEATVVLAYQGPEEGLVWWHHAAMVAVGLIGSGAGCETVLRILQPFDPSPNEKTQWDRVARAACTLIGIGFAIGLGAIIGPELGDEISPRLGAGEAAFGGLLVGPFWPMIRDPLGELAEAAVGRLKKIVEDSDAGS